MGGLVGGLIGQKIAKKGVGVAEDQVAAAIAELEKVGIPSIEAQRIVLERPDLIPQIIPELEMAQLLGPSALEGVTADPFMEAKQRENLERLGELSRTGLTPIEKAELSELRRDVSEQEEARRKSIEQKMAERGMTSSGLNIASQLLSSQRGAERQSEESDRQAEMAYKRALEAIGMETELAGDLRSRKFGEESQSATAKDYVREFNKRQEASVEQRNIAARNIAAQTGQKQRQEHQYRTADIQKQEEMFNKQLIQQKFQNEMLKSKGLFAGKTGQAQMGLTAAQQRAQGVQAIGTGIDTAGAALGAAAITASDKDSKTNIRPGTDDLKEMLSRLKSYKFDYKEPELHGDGERVGVMADDLEKSSLGKTFVEEDELGTKYVDYNKMAPTMLATQTELAEGQDVLDSKHEKLKQRLEKLESLLSRG